MGQNEISVAEMVDFFLLLKISGSGDELQGIKRGIIEMSDLIAINKCDGNNVENSIKAKNEFKLALQLFPKKKSDWNPQVLTCSSLTGDGKHKLQCEESAEALLFIGTHGGTICLSSCHLTDCQEVVFL